MIWTDKQAARLIQARKDGLSYEQMAERFGVSRSAIAGKFHRIDGRDKRSERIRTPRPRKPASELKAMPARWDDRLFEPYADFKARKKLERASCRE